MCIRDSLATVHASNSGFHVWWCARYKPMYVCMCVCKLSRCDWFIVVMQGVCRYCPLFSTSPPACSVKWRRRVQSIFLLWSLLLCSVWRPCVRRRCARTRAVLSAGSVICRALWQQSLSTHNLVSVRVRATHFSGPGRAIDPMFVCLG